MPFGDIPQDMFDRFKASPALTSRHVDEALCLVLGKKVVTKKNAGSKVIVLGLEKDSKKGAAAAAAEKTDGKDDKAAAATAKGGGKGGKGVTDGKIEKKDQQSAAAKPQPKGNGKGQVAAKTEKADPKLDLKITADTAALPRLTRILVQFLKESCPAGCKPHYVNRVVIRAGAKHGHSNMDIKNLSGVLPELRWAGGQETIPPGAPWWSDGESVGLAISEVKLRHKVLSIDPRIAGVFSFTKTETSVANAVNFQFLIQASAVGAEDLNRMGTAVKIFEMGLKSYGFPAWNGSASTFASLPKLPAALAEKNIRIKLAVSKYRQAHEVPKDSEDGKNQKKRKYFCPQCQCEQCKKQKIAA